MLSRVRCYLLVGISYVYSATTASKASSTTYVRTYLPGYICFCLNVLHSSQHV